MSEMFDTEEMLGDYPTNYITKKRRPIMSLINHKQVKKFYKDNGKQLSRKGLESVEDMLQLKLRASITNARGFARVKDTEILMAFGALNLK